MKSKQPSILQGARLFFFSGIVVFLTSCSGSRESINTNTPDPQESKLAPVTEAQPDTLPAEEQRILSLKEVYKKELFDKYNSDASQLANYYILAQQKLFTGEYLEALSLINKAPEMKENPDVLALKGSIYLGLGQTDEFLSNWRRALELDPEVPILPSTYVIQQLQLYGLIDENLRKNF